MDQQKKKKKKKKKNKKKKKKMDAKRWIFIMNPSANQIS